MTTDNCKARQYSDQMQCGACGLAWDVNDPEPPACRPGYTPDLREQQRKQRDKLRAPLTYGKLLDLTLPDGTVRYEISRSRGRYGRVGVYVRAWPDESRDSVARRLKHARETVRGLAGALT